MIIRRLLVPGALLLTLGVVLGLAPQDTEPERPLETYSVDPVHSTAIFRVHHLGAGRFYGRFNDVTGSFQFAEGGTTNLSFDVGIAIESVDTNNEQLDRHLKSPDFFNAREFPQMTFKTKSSKKVGDTKYEVTGDLTIHGITRPLVTEVEWTGSADLGRGHRCGFEARFTVKRSEFEVMYGVSNGMLGDDTHVIVSLEGVRQ